MSNKVINVTEELRQAESLLENNPRAENAERLHYLDRLRIEWRRAHRIVDPGIFISFAGERGHELFTKTIPLVSDTVAGASGTRFKPTSGMRREGDVAVLEHVLANMRPCFGFIGIVNQVHKLEGGNGFPGSWVLYEAGMALALGLFCVLIIEEGIEKESWERIVGSKRQVLYRGDESQFKLAVKEAMKIMNAHYRNTIASTK